MKTIIKIFADTNYTMSSSEFIKLREVFFAALQKKFGDEMTKIGDGWIELSPSSLDHIQSVTEISLKVGMNYKYVVEEKFNKNERISAKFVRIEIEGEPVDLNSDGLPINSYKEFYCESCLMPNENEIPNPYFINASEVTNIGKNYWGEGLLTPNRDIFSGDNGVIIVTTKLKDILKTTLGNELFIVPANTYIDSEVELKGLWAIRPKINWGIEKGRIEYGNCKVCGEAIEARFEDSESIQISQNRISLKKTFFPNAEIVYAEGWYGDRKKHPFAIHRDIFVSGRLYELLLLLKIRGLCKPSKLVSIDNNIPMNNEKESKIWVKKQLEHLELSLDINISV